MRSLQKAVRTKGRAGEPLPQPVRAIRELGFVQRRGQLSLIVAAPGVGKSLVALHVALRAGVPCLYLSADTDRSDQGERAMCLLAGVTMNEVKDDPDRYLPVLAQIPRDVRFEFDSAPTASNLKEMCDAYRMVFGYFPHLVVVDTIGKIWSDVGDENARNKEAVDNCQGLARYTGAHVMAAHHATKGYDSGDKPIPLDGLMSGTSKVPEQILTMWRSGADTIALSPVKNRSGPSDPTAMHMRAFLQIDFTRVAINEAYNQMVWDYSLDPELS